MAERKGKGHKPDVLKQALQLDSGILRESAETWRRLGRVSSDIEFQRIALEQARQHDLLATQVGLIQTRRVQSILPGGRRIHIKRR